MIDTPFSKALPAGGVQLFDIPLLQSV